MTEAYLRKKDYRIKELIDFDFVSKFYEDALDRPKNEYLNFFFRKKTFNNLKEVELDKFLYNYYAFKQNIDSSKQYFSMNITVFIAVFLSALLNFVLNYLNENLSATNGKTIVFALLVVLIGGSIMSIIIWWLQIYKPNQLFTAYNYVASLLIEQGVLED
ncbi:hypothetical protein [Enterococcus sp. LJL90]